MSKVLIVGAGPIGLLLATSLRRYNVDVSIIDKIGSRNSNFSKALSVTSASLKVFHGLGIAQDFLMRGKKITRAEVFFNKKRVACVNKKYLTSLYNFYLSISQSETEHIIEKKLNEHSTFVQYQKELTSVSQCKEHVEVTIKDLKNKKIKSECFDFVVGCDGAHSNVRKLLDIPFVGDDYNVYFILCDVCFYESSVPGTTYYVDEKGFLGLFPMENGYVRVVFQKKGESSDLAPKPTIKELQTYLDDYLPNKLSVNDLGWSSSVRIVNRIAQSHRVERVFLAGDACHLFSPVGGQGMNTGIQDAFDLGWKLGHYLKGIAKLNLLDTYGQDRMLAAKKVLASTDFCTRLIIGDNVISNKLKYFQPNFKNRESYRKELPTEFSGYKADYTQNDKSIVGMHVPYVEFQRSDHSFESTYDLPQLKKHVLFIPESLSRSNELQELALYSRVIVKIKVQMGESELIKRLQLEGQNMCMICPSGYVVVHGQLSKLVEYFQRHYLVET